MNTQHWTLEGKISGNFRLTAELLESSAPPHPLVVGFALEPEFDGKGDQTGVFKLTVKLKIETESERPEGAFLADLDKDVFSIYVDFLTLLSGNPVQIIKPPELTFNEPGTNKYRKVFIPSQSTVISPPTAITNTTIFQIPVDYQIQKALSWYRKGLEELDVVDSFISLSISLEILSNHFPTTEMIVRNCPQCGYELQYRPSTGKQVEHFFVSTLGYDKKKFDEIWNTRHRVLHGGFKRTSDETQKLHQTRDGLFLALTKALVV